MPRLITCFKQPPWISYETPSSPESSPASSPASSRAGTPLPERRAAPHVLEQVRERATERAGGPSLPEMMSDVPFSSDVLDLSSQTSASAAASLAKLQRALGMGDGQVAGIWVQLPNGVRTPMILKRHGDNAIELALLYEKRHADGTGPVDRADLLKRLKGALTAGSKTAFKCYGHLTEVWKARNETAGACHRRIVDELQWHASVGKTLHAGLEEERELRDIVGDPKWQVLQKRRADEHSLGFALPRETTSSVPHRGRDDMTKVIAAKLDHVAAESSRGARAKSPAYGNASPAAQSEGPYPAPTAMGPRPRRYDVSANRTVLLDLMPRVSE